ncbi:protein sprint-like isoform X3 [Crassostrea virginica]
MVGEDSAFGTLASTDSYSQDDKSETLKSRHLAVFTLQQNQSQQIPNIINESEVNGPVRTCSETNLEQRHISFQERLTKTHAIWYLPDIGRSGAVHLLKDREPGTFIIRNSSQPSTLALSVQFPEKNRPNVDHYLIQHSERGFKVQGSLHYFTSIFHLLDHYHHWTDELPCPLLLPPTIRRASTLQELTSLSYLGQDFWTSYKFDRGSQMDLSMNKPNLQKSKSEPINIIHGTHCVPRNPLHMFQQQGSSSTLDTIGKSSQSSQSKGSLNQTPPSVEDCVGRGTDQMRPFRTGGSAESLLSNDSCGGSVNHPSQTSLYFTTSLDLLNIPEENQYFKSNLSDKMSDYEDIWRHSVSSHSMLSPTPSTPKKKSSKKGKRKKKDIIKEEEKDVLKEEVVCDSHADTTNIGPEKQFNCDVNASTYPCPKPKSNIHRTLSLDDYKIKNAVRSDDLNVDLLQVKFNTSSVHTQTSPKVKAKPSPLPVNDDSSSTSTALSSAKSPVYAEPFDTLNDVEVKKVNRRSAPTMGIHKRKARAVSQTPELETIFSPGYDHGEGHHTFTQFESQTSKITSDHKALRRTQSAKVKSGCKSDKETDPLPPSISALRLDSKNIVLRKHFHKHTRSNMDLQKQCVSNSASQTIHQSREFSWEELSKEQQSEVTSTLRKFPVYKRKISCESTSTDETATMEDMISSVNPTIPVRPVQFLSQAHHQHNSPSEYDNLRNPTVDNKRQSHLSTGTVFCNPWDNVSFEALMNPKFFPAMDANERIQAWQLSHHGRDSLMTESTLDFVSNGEDDDDDVDESDDETCDEAPQVIVHPPSTDGSVVMQNHGCDPQVSSQLPPRLFPPQDYPDVCKTAMKSVIENRLSVHSYGGFGDNLPKSPDCRNFQQMPFSSAQEGMTGSTPRPRTPESKINDYICRLSKDKSTTFGCTIENFIQCTLESQESNPHHVTRNVRQFMTGIRNYLVKHGEGELEDLIEHERARLKQDEILNIDNIIERSLHICVLHPLKLHIYNLFVTEYTRNGSLQTLSSNIRFARTKSAKDIGIRPGIPLPDSGTMDSIKGHLHAMQKAYSPLKKMECLLAATSTIYKCMTQKLNKKEGVVTIGADDFLPMLIFVLVQCGTVAAEIEADYMWGLIHPSLLNGEGGYYLTSLSSAVLALKNFRNMQGAPSDPQQVEVPTLGDMEGFLKVAIPDELRDSIIWKTLPVRPNMTTKDVCSMIAHKFRITNPQDYGLYLLVNGEETRLSDMNIPQMLKSEHNSQGRQPVFAYKRNAAIIAWPMAVKKQVS